MNPETIREYCLSLPHAEEYFPFDETTLAFKVKGKIFAMIDLEDTTWFVLKCNPDRAIALRDEYCDIQGAWHMNKRHWNQLNLFGTLPEELIPQLIRHSYAEVVKKLPKKIKQQYPEILSVE